MLKRSHFAYSRSQLRSAVRLSDRHSTSNGQMFVLFFGNRDYYPAQRSGNVKVANRCFTYGRL